MSRTSRVAQCPSQSPWNEGHWWLASDLRKPLLILSITAIMTFRSGNSPSDGVVINLDNYFTCRMQILVNSSKDIRPIRNNDKNLSRNLCADPTSLITASMLICTSVLLVIQSKHATVSLCSWHGLQSKLSHFSSRALRVTIPGILKMLVREKLTHHSIKSLKATMCELLFPLENDFMLLWFIEEGIKKWF